MFRLIPWFDFSPFHSKVKSDLLGFWKKSENYLFMLNIAALGLKVG